MFVQGTTTTGGPWINLHNKLLFEVYKFSHFTWGIEEIISDT